jgi:catechol 2,3-dioxygenase-like lactoylglutathione lyase family enzyme
VPETTNKEWPDSLRAVQVRVARPTDRLAEVETFYAKHLGLRVIYRFDDHDEYAGVMLGLPGSDYHLEFTSRAGGSACPAPSQDNLLVFYFAAAADMRAVVARLAAAGHQPVEPENPYWLGVGALTFEDPDGWRVVLVPTPVAF